MKSGKLGFEGTQEVQHRIRITLSSKSLKNLDKVGSYIPSFPLQDPLLAATGSPRLRQQRLWFDAHLKMRRDTAKRTWVGEIGTNDYAYNFMVADSIPPARIWTMAVDRVTTFLELPISSYGGTRRSLAGCPRPPRPCNCCLRSWSTISSPSSATASSPSLASSSSGPTPLASSTGELL